MWRWSISIMILKLYRIAICSWCMDNVCWCCCKKGKKKTSLALCRIQFSAGVHPFPFKATLVHLQGCRPCWPYAWVRTPPLVRHDITRFLTVWAAQYVHTISWVTYIHSEVSLIIWFQVTRPCYCCSIGSSGLLCPTHPNVATVGGEVATCRWSWQIDFVLSWLVWVHGLF